jgi:hypothetical protein
MRLALRRFRHDLAGLLVVCCILGGAIGLVGWYYLTHPNHVYNTYPEFIFRQRDCEGFSLSACWSRTPWEREQLVYLVVGRSDLGVDGFSTQCIMFSPWDSPRADETDLHPLGLFLHGNRAIAPAGERFWFMLAKIPDEAEAARSDATHGVFHTICDVRALRGTAGPDANLTVAQFKVLERLPLWKGKVRPELMRQLAEFCKAYQKRRHANPKAYPQLLLDEELAVEIDKRSRGTGEPREPGPGAGSTIDTKP